MKAFMCGMKPLKKKMKVEFPPDDNGLIENKPKYEPTLEELYWYYKNGGDK